MKKYIFLTALLSIGISALANTNEEKPQTLSVVCAVNTYNNDGSNFKSLIAQDFDLTIGKRTEVIRSANAVYTVLPEHMDQGKEARDTLFVEIQDLKSGNTIAAGETEWRPGETGLHQVTAYSSVAEPGIKTMLWCQVNK